MFGLDIFSSKARISASLEEVTTIGDEEEDPHALGLEPAALESVWHAVERYYRSGIHPAIQVCLRYRGRIALDRAIGHAHGNGPGDDPEELPVLATPETPFNIFSASKAVTAMLMHLLDQEKLLHLDDHVCEFIPEFGKHGKDKITIRHLLAHRAGIPNIPAEAMELDNLSRPDEVLRILSEARPIHRPGQNLAYHAISSGFVLAEVVQRVTGSDIRTVLEQRILKPLRFRWMRYGTKPKLVPLVARNYYTGPPQLPVVSYLLRRALSIPVQRVVELSNDPRFLTGVIPSGNVVTTAEELSRFYQLLLNGGELDGTRIFDARTIRRATSEQSYFEFDSILGLPIRYSLGFMLGARWLSLYGPDTDRTFGHLGFTNIIGWADPDRELAGAVITSGKPLVYPEIIYAFELMRQIGQAFPKVV
ncbi:MAG TPA: serine hydrolase domain-containing protein [Terriglobales bacterium]|nr:serine hydrolase domain-containing protein [Terriglobales bacterium]